MTEADIEQALNNAFKAVMPRIQGEEGEGAVTSRPLQGEPAYAQAGCDGKVHKSLTSPDISAQPAPRKATAQ